MTEHDGQRYLQSILPIMRAEVATISEDELKMEAISPIAKAFMPHITENNLHALMIYQAPVGGWHADLVLKDTPPGIPNALGTPVASPCATRDEAIEQGHKLVRLALVVARNNHNQPLPIENPAFLLYSTNITLFPDLYEKLLSHCPAAMEGYGTPSYAITRLEQVLTRIFGHHDKITIQQIQNLTPEDRLVLMTVVHMAALSGVYRYPPRRDGMPSDIMGQYS